MGWWNHQIAYKLHPKQPLLDLWSPMSNFLWVGTWTVLWVMQVKKTSQLVEAVISTTWWNDHVFKNELVYWVCKILAPTHHVCFKDPWRIHLKSWSFWMVGILKWLHESIDERTRRRRPWVWKNAMMIILLGKIYCMKGWMFEISFF